MKTQRTTPALLKVILCVLALGCRIWADDSFFEDFSDGDIKDDSPVTWRWDANKGQCVLTPQGLQLKPSLTGYSMPGSHLNAYAQKNGADVQFTGNIRIRAQMNIGSGLHACGVVSVRTSQSTGYGFKIAGGGYQLGHLNGYSNPSWGSYNTGRYDVQGDVIVQLDAIDIIDDQGKRISARLECRLWLPGQDMPAMPDVVVIDNAYASGGVAISTSADALNATSPTTFRWVEVTHTEVEKIHIVDFNGNGTVDIKDLVKLIDAWGQDDPTVDLVPDGIIDVGDLEILMDYWHQDVNDPTLLANWKLDETEGDVACDSAMGNDATVLGEPEWQPQAGQMEGALTLDGVDDCVTTPCILDPSKGIFSIYAWVKGGAPGQVILSQTGGANWLAIDESGSLCTDLISEGRYRGQSLHSAMMITDGQWHRIGLVWDRTYRSLYVDDELAATDTTPQGNFPSITGEHCLGAGNTSAPGTFWSGLMDEVRIYNRVVVP